MSNEFEVSVDQYENLTEKEKNNSSNNGSGKEYASYIRVSFNGKTILLENDAIEPEDAFFNRDLSWIPGIIKKAFELGKSSQEPDLSLGK